ncbi:helix-turn-helix transcriptional regulator [uncultured Limosilactobacillus sp.]|uniref:helix-turn-helix domain-containing protein n=1 Tax=uncultured Limosilactobacillus sp. TaxID=2837629 RepID=UPI0025E3EAA1|nr:helix-turn-helix transcriptional regulator [uncultured Limosilactobacillus sp.]
MVKFSKQLTTLRQATGLSQEQLANQLHISRQAVSKWENGTAIPDIDKIVQIANILHVSLDELVLGQKPQLTPSTVANKQRPHISNGWDFLAHYWWLLFALAGLIYGFYGMIH